MRLHQLILLGAMTFIAACGPQNPTQESTLADAVKPDPVAATAQNNPDEKEWIDLFNGRDLNNWTVKIAGYPAGEDPFDTFQVQDGILQIRYDNYDEFANRFGHIVYNDGPFSHYIVQIEYRFVGEQMRGGPAWASRNNGIMYHTQSATEMGLTQWFPTSMEYQLLGGDGENERTTANLCTPDTNVVINGELRTDHCINSASETYHGDQWVAAELIVHGSELAQHFVEGKLVMEYNGLQLDDGTPLAKGYIALQAETHPTDFRKVRLLNLEGCMDEKAKNFKSYLVKNNPAACVY
jgi:hypothetical protein